MMAETLTPLIVATIAFIGSHFLLSALPVRTPLVQRLGRWGFIALHSVVSAATFVWMNYAFARAPVIDLWPGADWAYWTALALMLVACVLLVCGMLTPNPTAVIGAHTLKREDAATGIFTVTRHPVMWAILLWAVSHVLNVGDAAALIYFASLGGLALFGMIHMDARRDAERDPDWLRFRSRTSFIPFAAALTGRARISLAEIGWIRMALGVGFYFLLLYAHEWVIGIVVAPWVSVPN